MNRLRAKGKGVYQYATAAAGGLWALVVLFFLLFFELRKPPSNQFDQGGLARPLPILDEPISLNTYPLSRRVCDDAALAKLVTVARPYWGRYKVPISMIYHALRVWGPRAPFDKSALPVRSDDGVFGDGLFLRVLLDDEVYKAYSKFTLGRLLVPSTFGVQVVTSGDGGWGQVWGSTHAGKYLQVMADLGIAPNHALRLDDGMSYNLRNVIEHEARSYSSEEEVEWVACGLARYLKVDHWQTRFQDWVTFDDLANRLIETPFGDGACIGTHVPYALATLLNVDTQRHILSYEVRDRARQRLREYTTALSNSQRQDGSWGADWWVPHLSGSMAGSFQVDTNSLIATGHHLEWFVLTPPDLRPKDHFLEAAIRYLSVTIPLFENHIRGNFHHYLPVSHALRAILSCHGKIWADAAFIEQRTLLDR